MKKSLYLATFALASAFTSFATQADEDKEASRYAGKLIEVQVGLGEERSIVKTCTLNGIGKLYDVAKVRELITQADKEKELNKIVFVKKATNSIKVVAHIVTEVAPNDGGIKTKPVPLLDIDGSSVTRKGEATQEILKIASKACDLPILWKPKEDPKTDKK